MKLLVALIALTLFLLPIKAQAGSNYEYQLYKNHENYGIVVFPKKFIQKELSDYIASIAFLEVESGKAVMRRGSKNENESLMMPLEVQKKYSIKKFVVIQVLTQREMLVGIYDPEWGLTLPSSSFGLETLKQNIPKTLNAFRGDNPQRRTAVEYGKNPIFVNSPKVVIMEEKTIEAQSMQLQGDNYARI
tara:strand:+ start:590 stop:1156 length:567 start_codon:yes stop_codon:yes gene_type:complete